ncbi:Rieske 2Fe-2S domain-containing protein [Jatrophihabitans lederbergiae]|uniref:Rieske 2Fe-2S domain-containing protein n=1 Tax=Jatrophihabitans lederbergiae TaxID=3075547 RepID=A0ABU2JBU0_9ACTN|nr:Rieske 2Fe-2S domain-containing protein [Jatrophihabitans sp. DSM 44399]MDT0262452.1 Rieske 2Fe-2S domain-containing protein [Jatrophihabitans sp. DSM 44399]
MLSAEQNNTLTHVGPGTPTGQLLRSYWHPIAAGPAVAPGTVQAVRLLGENLALFRTEDGELGLVPARCPHRGASLALGFVEGQVLRCAYHGWAFDRSGMCVETPNEPAGSRLTELASTRSLPVLERGGLVFGHLGGTADPAPGITALGPLADPDAITVRIDVLPCNWLQIAENGMDPTHLEWLHGHFRNAQSRLRGAPEPFAVRPHDELAFEETPLGLVKRRRLVGESRDEAGEDWEIGQQLIFPGILYHCSPSYRGMQFRTPIDDEHTLHIWWEGRDADEPSVTVAPSTTRRPDGSWDLDSIDGQDAVVWASQGSILDRTRERLGVADRGITMFRHMLFAEIARAADGLPPRNSDLVDVVDLPRRTATTAVLLPR